MNSLLLKYFAGQEGAYLINNPASEWGFDGPFPSQDIDQFPLDLERQPEIPEQSAPVVPEPPWCLVTMALVPIVRFTKMTHFRGLKLCVRGGRVVVPQRQRTPFETECQF